MKNVDKRYALRTPLKKMITVSGKVTVKPTLFPIESDSLGNFFTCFYCRFIQDVPSNRVISALEGKFGRVGEPFVLVLEGLFMKISNLCKNHL